MANTPRVEFNVQLMAEDMAVNGLDKLGLSKKAKVADMTVIRFLRAESQTARTAAKLAKALGHSVERYVVRSSQSTDSTTPVAERRTASA